MSMSIIQSYKSFEACSLEFYSWHKKKQVANVQNSNFIPKPINSFHEKSQIIFNASLKFQSIGS